MARNDDKTVGIAEASKRLGMTVPSLRKALKQNIFDFGVAIQTSENRCVYHINRVKFEEYIKGRE